MRAFLENLCSIGILLGTEAWFLDGYFSGNPEYEPAIAFMTALAVVLAKDPVRAHLAKRPEINNHDKELFEKILSILPPNQTVRFFKEHDFGSSFSRSKVENIYKFADTWRSVENEFIDPELELKNQELYNAASDLASEISSRTVPLRGGDLSSVYSDNQRNLGGPRPPSVIEDAKVINKNASNFVGIYEEFIRFCRAKLKSDL